MDMNRRGFLKGSLFAGAAAVSGCASSRLSDFTEGAPMHGYAAPALNTIVFGAGALALALSGFAAERKLYVEDFRDRMAGAWIGQSVGVSYGWPTEFRYVGKLVPDEKMPSWKAELINETFSQDDLYVEMSFLRTLETHGIDVGVREAGIDFANSRYRLWCANANAR